MIVQLLTEHHLEFLSLKGGCTVSSESTHAKISNCWKSHALAQIKEDLESSNMVANVLPAELTPTPSPWGLGQKVNVLSPDHPP